MTPATSSGMNNVVPFPVQKPQFLRGDEVEIADTARRKLGALELTHDLGRFWQYDPRQGIWAELAPEVIHRVIADFSGAPVVVGGRATELKISSRTISGATAILRDTILADSGHRRFAVAMPGLTFENGFVHVVDGRIVLEKHSADQLARHAYPFPYEPFRENRCLDLRRAPPGARLLGFIHALFADVDYDERQERVRLFQEFVGTSLIGQATRHQQALVMFGEGGNGKSEALELARSAFPGGSVVSLPPQLWSQRFQIAHLVGALGNFVDEVPERDITGGETFKSVITGDFVHAEEKNQQPFDYRPVAGHIFSANTLPGTVDQSDGYWRRFIVLPFTRNMTEAAGHRQRAASTVIDSELPAVVSWFLEGAARVQRQGRYTIPESSATMTEAWRRNADSVLRFAAEECEPDATVMMKAPRLFEAYCGWAAIQRFAPMSSTTFYKRFAKTGIARGHAKDGNFYGCRIPREPTLRVVK